jgi:prepilin peptidase CpaA
MLLAFQSVYLLCICYAIVSDFRNLIIPNWVIIILVATFVAFAATHVELGAILSHVAVMGFVFMLFLAFFIAGWVAGGDVKFIAAISLWMGMEHIVNFALLTAFLGSLLALGLLQFRKHSPLFSGALGNTWLFQRVSTLAESRQCPYGVAIGAAALLASARIFQ